MNPLLGFFLWFLNIFHKFHFEHSQYEVKLQCSLGPQVIGRVEGGGMDPEPLLWLGFGFEWLPGFTVPVGNHSVPVQLPVQLFGGCALFENDLWHSLLNTGWCPEIHPLHGRSTSEANHYCRLPGVLGRAVLCETRIVGWVDTVLSDTRWSVVSGHSL